MRSFFSPNIGSKGRLFRGLAGLGLLAAGGFAFTLSAWLGVALTISGMVGLFESLRGWCLLRACGINTKL